MNLLDYMNPVSLNINGVLLQYKCVVELSRKSLMEVIVHYNNDCPLSHVIWK